MAVIEVVGRTGSLSADFAQESSWKFVVKGVSDDVAAEAAVFDWCESTFGAGGHRSSDLRFYSVAADERIVGVYDCTAKWKNLGPRQTGQTSFNFELGLQPVKVVVPIGSIAVYPAPGAPAVNVHLIGDRLDGKEPAGAEIFEPTYSESITTWVSAAAIEGGYAATLKTLVGKTNSSLFQGHSAGEALMMGISGSRRSVWDDWEVKIKWSVRENQSGLTVAGVSGIDKGGWQYLWPISNGLITGDRIYRSVSHVCVATVFASADLNLAFS